MRGFALRLVVVRHEKKKKENSAFPVRSVQCYKGCLARADGAQHQPSNANTAAQPNPWPTAVVSATSSRKSSYAGPSYFGGALML